jgi:hypothetical protein
MDKRRSISVVLTQSDKRRYLPGLKVAKTGHSARPVAVAPAAK